MVNGGKVNTEKYYSVVGGGTTGLLAFYTYSATNVRLREATLGYTFPDQWFRGAVKNVKLSLIGKNCLCSIIRLLLILNWRLLQEPIIRVSTFLCNRVCVMLVLA